MKHKEGPWEIRRDLERDKIVEIFPTSNEDGIGCIADVMLNSPEAEANACLIAAAPELLETLEAIVARIKGEFDNDSLMYMGPLGVTGEDIYRIARKAINKTER